MKLLTRNGRYELISTFEERAFPKSAGFRWDPARKIWWTDKKENAARLVEHADPDVREELGQLAVAQQTAAQESRATDAAFEVPIAAGEAYLPFQRAGISYATKRPCSLIADEMGLGKTIQAIGVINATPAIQRVMIVCPASLKINWHRELKRFLARPFDIQVVNGRPIDMAMPGRGQIVILNYDILKKHRAALMEMKFDLLVLDEAHYIKNADRKKTKDADGKEVWVFKTQRTQLIFDLAAVCARKVLLTGTPILNRPKELWTLLHLLDPKRWPSFFSFGKRYAAGYQGPFGWNFDGASNLDELQRILRETVMVRRLKKDVLTELPAKRRQVIELPAPAEMADYVDAENAAEERWEAESEAAELARDFAKVTDNTLDYEAAVARLRQVKTAAFTEMSILRHKTALAKVPQVIDHVKGVLEQTDKVIVFTHHLDVAAGIGAGLAEFQPLMLTGEQNKDDRQASIDAFQTNPARRVIIVSIAIAVGFTLTAASVEVFAELDWVPGNITQAEDRAHRIGQTASVLIHHVVLENSLDCRLAKTLVAKQEVIDKALDRAAAAIQVDLPKRRRMPADLPLVEPEQVPFIHEALRFLSARCDHASSKDGQGFNKLDAGFGHDLAHRGQLTINQAAFGFRIVRKYRRQLPTPLTQQLGISRGDD